MNRTLPQKQKPVFNHSDKTKYWQHRNADLINHILEELKRDLQQLNEQMMHIGYPGDLMYELARIVLDQFAGYVDLLNSQPEEIIKKWEEIKIKRAELQKQQEEAAQKVKEVVKDENVRSGKTDPNLQPKPKK